MANLIVEAELSLDGVLNGESPDFWTRVFGYHSDDVVQYLNDLLFSSEALLMGRATYEGFAQVWPTRSGAQADKINGMSKFVASNSLKGALAWNATLLGSDIAQEIAKLKAQLGGNLVQYGVGELTRTMLHHGLVDELRLLVYPFVFGRGQRVFAGFDASALKLEDTKTFSSGAVVMRYRPVR